MGEVEGEVEDVELAGGGGDGVDVCQPPGTWGPRVETATKVPAM